jgi:hypothetical protein
MAHGSEVSASTVTRTLRTLLVVLLLILLPACGGDGSGVEDDIGPAETLAPSGPLVTLLRYGGIAGAQDRVSVDAIGVATVISDRADNTVTRTLTPTDLAALRSALRRADIKSLRRNYLDRQARDAYQYDVTYQGTTVTADEGVIPDKLRPVVDQLTKLIP